MIHPELDPLLEAAREHSASDLILQEGRRPFLRIDSRIVEIESGAVDSSAMDALWKACNAPPETADFDSALSSQGGGRFRVNLLRQLGVRAAVLRRIRTDIPNFDSLGLPGGMLRHWVARRSGLVLICGPTGSGKSTSVAAMLDWINREESKHIVTIEDPVEYLFTPVQSVITQREVGLDTPSFAEGMRRALRQSPDVIFVGEIRDMETARIALQASETGHLVLSTLHAGRAAESVTRFELLFPTEEREFVRKILARELAGVLCQRLVPTLGGGIAAALEYFANSGAVSKYLAEGSLAELADLIANPRTQETRSLTQDLIAKLSAGRISEETARAYAPEPTEINRALRGIK